jgi:hypothetical protein
MYFVWKQTCGSQFIAFPSEHVHFVSISIPIKWILSERLLWRWGCGARRMHSARARRQSAGVAAACAEQKCPRGKMPTQFQARSVQAVANSSIHKHITTCGARTHDLWLIRPSL